MIYKFDLNDSQRDAVISCLGATYCVHKPSVRLIWGPPSTGKTKTVAVMLFYLLLAKKQALVCAPSNMAIMQVASQLVELIEKNPVENKVGRLVLGSKFVSQCFCDFQVLQRHRLQ
jgi:senataxin